MNGYIKLHRKFLEWWWYQDMVVKTVFLHILLTASYKDFEWKGEQYKAGQLITSKKKLGSQLGISPQQLRTALDKLKSSGAINIKSTNAFSVITVVNWQVYQIEEYEEQQTKRTASTTNHTHLNNKESRISPLCGSPSRGRRKRKERSYGSYDLDAFEEMLEKAGNEMSDE